MCYARVHMRPEDNIWTYHDRGHWVAVTTNGVVTKANLAVMGAGVALEAKRRFPSLPLELAAHLRKKGNVVGVFPEYRVFTFPTKHDWRNPSSLALIQQSTEDLCRELCTAALSKVAVYMPPPGCGNGQLTVTEVKPVVTATLVARGVFDRVHVLWNAAG